MSNSIGITTSAQDRTRFTVEMRDEVVLVFGSIPATKMNAVTALAPKKSIISPELAHMAGANFAFGLAGDVDALLAKMRPEAERAASNRYANSGLSQAAVAWLASGRRGISSNTIFTVLTGMNVLGDWGQDTPSDPSDVGRCRKLLEQCPEFIPQFSKMASVSKAWAALVRDWDLICSTMDEETPDWRAGKGFAPKTYNLIKLALSAK